MLYINSETMTKLPPENEYFFIKASDYQNPNYIYIHFKETNVMLGHLEYCGYNGIPPDNFVCNDYSYSSFESLYPYKSYTENNTTHDYYEFGKHKTSRNIIVFHYKFKNYSDFLIEIECSKTKFDSDKDENNNNKSDDTLVIVIIICSTIAILAISGVVITKLCLRKKKMDKQEQELASNEFVGTNSGLDYNLNS